MIPTPELKRRLYPGPTISRLQSGGKLPIIGHELGICIGAAAGSTTRVTAAVFWRCSNVSDHSALREKLEKRLNQLAARVGEIEETLHVPGDPDFEEQATEQEGSEVLEGLSEAGREEIYAIRAALKRMDAGEYGVCTDCGKKIAPKRLEAVPHAAKCIDCA